MTEQIPAPTPALHDDALPHRSGVAWHYGDPLGEQTLPRVAIDRRGMRSVAVAGPDARSYLHSLFTQKLDDAVYGTQTELLNLDAQGHVLEHAYVTVLDDEILLTTEAAETARLQEYLERMKFWNDVTITARDTGIVTLLGSGDPVAETRALADIAQGAGIVRPVLGQDRPRVDILVDDAFTPLPPAGLLTFEAHRVMSLEPVVGVDTDEKTIPHEHPQWIGSAVHLDKGCYRGQETVARVHNVGRSPRVLVRLHVDGSAPQLPTTGTPITSGGRTVGRLGTIVHHHQWGPVALGTIKRSALGASLQAGDAALAIDPDTLPAEGAPQAGKLAQQRLRHPR
ncbi:folate-binding protein YgfZ [Corynebacterium sp. 13CS0277]|uniref:CAF17-like 4Fe-4S cluster assembly/insertion protein YgfZ n=1 Tax=Corynebacterium sp. 13CS0277 TaxID=2071994 RepID=UPI001304ECAD|nr:folate-binding protein [Corynebacterium sp. 13CS0277]